MKNDFMLASVTISIWTSGYNELQLVIKVVGRHSPLNKKINDQAWASI